MSKDISDLILIKPEKDVDNIIGLVRLDEGHLRQIVKHEDIISLSSLPVIVQVSNTHSGLIRASLIDFYENDPSEEPVIPEEANALLLGENYLFHGRTVRPALYCVLKDNPDAGVRRLPKGYQFASN